MYEQQGLDALWEWAKGKPDRFKALMQFAQGEVRDLKRDLDHEREAVQEARDDLHKLGDKIVEVRKVKRDHEEKLAEAKTDERKAQLQSAIRDADRELEKLLTELGKTETRKKRAKVAAHDAKQEKKVWLERKVIYRETWEKIKKRQQDKGGGYENAEWDDSMAHGLNTNVTAFVKKVLAWGYLDFDLYITSMRRDYVPAGGSTTSYHLVGKAGDIAGARMAEFQKAVYEKFRGNPAILELFGPDNSLNLKYGSPLYLAEGSALENLHDTHVHVAG